MSIINKQFKIASWTLNYWGVLYIPDNIQAKVPLVIFCHGAGQIGKTQASTSALYTYGPLNFINNGWSPNFMVLAMQDPNWSPTPSSIDYVLKNEPAILANWDGVNCLVTGLSAGGESTVSFMDQDANHSFVYIPMSPAGNATLKKPNVPHKTWFFSGKSDAHFTDTAKALATATNGKLTLYDGGHCCWNTFYNPNYKEDGKNIYEFSFSASVPVNEAPVALAGPDQIIQLPASEVILSGGGTDVDGTIVNALWLEIERPEGTSPSEILSPNGFSTQVRRLSEGNYTFRLIVTDDKNTIATDDVVITVKKSDVETTETLIVLNKDEVLFETNLTDDTVIKFK